MPILSTFTLNISYSQLAVADSACEPPLNDWQDRHVAQGFAWRPGCVAFGTLESGGPMRIEVVRADSLDVDEAAERAIVVPFEVGAAGTAQVLDVFAYGPEVPRVVVGAGRHALLFETGHDHTHPEPDTMWARLTFIPCERAEPRILRADAQLSPGETLFLDARAV